MLLIILSILLGILLLGLEIFIVPGFIVGCLGLATCGYGVYQSFIQYGTTGGFIALAAVFILSVVIIALGLRAKTWKRLTLKENIDSSSQVTLDDEEISIGDRGTTTTRLAPIGKISVNGKCYEAKSEDIYIDQRKEIEVVGFENFTVIVRLVGALDPDVASVE